jgi:hypothetical protein
VRKRSRLKKKKESWTAVPYLSPTAFILIFTSSFVSIL